MSSAQSNRKAIILVSAALAVITVVLYLPTLHHQFINFDDDEYITANRHLQFGFTWAAVKWAFTSGYANNWHPLTWLGHLADYQLYQLKPWGHHLTNILLHTADTVLLFLLLRQLTEAFWRSALVAALFGWHPLHVESVAWAAELKDVLSTLFFLLTLMTYTRYVRMRDAQPVHHGNDRLWYAASLFLFALGLMAKPMLVTVPCVLLLLDWWPFKRINKNTWSRAALEKIPFLVLSYAVCVVTVIVQSKTIGFAHFPLPDRLINAVVAYGRYFGKIFWPQPLVVIYPYYDPKTYSIWLIAAGALLLIGGSCLSWAKRHTMPYVAFGWLWFFGMLVPVIGIVQVGSQSMADRYMYLPSIGIFMALVWGLRAAAKSPRATKAAVALTLAALCGCIIKSHFQLQYWQDSETLFRHAIQSTKNNDIAYNNLGCVFLEHGKLEEARECFSKALRVRPDATSFVNMGVTLKQQSKLDEARQYLLQAVKLRADHGGAYYHLGTISGTQGETKQAVEYFRKAVHYNSESIDALNALGVALGALAADEKSHANNVAAQTDRVEAALTFSNALSYAPNNLEARLNLANILADEGHNEEAIDLYGDVLKRSPTNAIAHYNLGTTFAEIGRVKDAAKEFSETLRLNPQHALAHNNLGMILLDDGKVEEAIKHFQKAAELSPSTSSVQYNLGTALLRLGKKDEAKEALTQAVTLDPTNTEAANKLQRLELR